MPSLRSDREVLSGSLHTCSAPSPELLFADLPRLYRHCMAWSSQIGLVSASIPVSLVPAVHALHTGLVFTGRLAASALPCGQDALNTCSSPKRLNAALPAMFCEAQTAITCTWKLWKPCGHGRFDPKRHVPRLSWWKQWLSEPHKGTRIRDHAA